MVHVSVITHLSHGLIWKHEHTCQPLSKLGVCLCSNLQSHLWLCPGIGGDLLILSFAILFLKLFSPQLLSASALPAIDCQWRSADRVDSINYTRAQTQRLGRVANI